MISRDLTVAVTILIKLRPTVLYIKIYTAHNVGAISGGPNHQRCDWSVAAPNL